MKAQKKFFFAAGGQNGAPGICLTAGCSVGILFSEQNRYFFSRISQALSDLSCWQDGSKTIVLSVKLNPKL